MVNNCEEGKKSCQPTGEGHRDTNDVIVNNIAHTIYRNLGLACQDRAGLSTLADLIKTAFTAALKEAVDLLLR